jgi:rhodanese-related sulfurtransferase
MRIHKSRMIGILLIVTLVVVACGGGSPAGTPAALPAPATPAATATPAPVSAAGATQPTSPLREPAAEPADGAATTPANAMLALPRNAEGYVDLSVTQLRDFLQAKNFTLVNVHIPYEGELPATDRFIPFDEMATKLDQLPAKDAPIVLYCRSGRMSTEAAAVLVEQGYTHVFELDGGFNAWVAEGHELLDQQ